MLVRCYGPVRFYFNEQLVYRSTVMDEISPDATVKLSIDIKPGWNTIWLEMKNTPAGFGCQFGSDEGKVRILNVFAPFQERQGQAGWVFSQPNPVMSKQLDLLGKESDYSLNWLPETGWSDEDKTKPAFRTNIRKSSWKTCLCLDPSEQ
ncbi:hypothetical protein Q0F98_18225 [Paenibacillus amylolyticus]|nr:hypothetical protein Q0F98_18225 [Paenibacillus amylolyticus]